MNEIFKDALSRMDKSYTVFQDNYRGISYAQSGSFLDIIKVEYFGSQTPINQLAVISRSYAGKFTIRPHDPTCIKEIEKAIMKANLNVGVSCEKTCVNVSVPSPTIEQRQDLVKYARRLAEEAKVAVRKIRQDIRTKLKKVSLSEDDEKKFEKNLQEQTDVYCGRIDVAFEVKEKNIMGD